MQAVTFQAPGQVRVQEKPDPEPAAPGDAVVRVTAAGVCGSDLHILHGRHPVEEGFTIGHEFAGEVVATADGVTRVKPGDRVTGSFVTACGHCFFCARGEFHHCVEQRIFGHGKISGDLQGAQADRVLVPNADMTLRPVPDGLDDDVALFAGDVMNTGVFAVRSAQVAPGDSVAILGMGPVGLCAVQAARHAGAETVLAVDAVQDRLEMARTFGAIPVHLTEHDPRAEVKRHTEGRGTDVGIEAVGTPAALDLAIRLTRRAGRLAVIGVHGKPCEVHMGLLWNKSLTVTTGLSNVLAHFDDVLALLAAGELDPSPLVQRHLPLSQAEEAYAAYDRREALKIVLTPGG
ncbi:MAG: alcohol dehydrogenase catalytic domain-containing protein [Actinomycetota bacterium]|nr:alcohol dehydrogenase catalytic domain-containing protein [Actinomycetota bacterium]